MKRNFLISLGLLAALSFTACKQEKNTEKTENTKMKKEQVKKEDTSNKPLAFETENQYEITRLYLDLKDALVKSDSRSAKKIAEIMLLKVEDKNAVKSIEYIVSNQDHIEAQREAFFGLSEYMEKVIVKNITGGKLYKQYCPMAFDGKGGFWLSENKEIMNPYFGDKMLHCGSIKETIK